MTGAHAIRFGGPSLSVLRRGRPGPAWIRPVDVDEVPDDLAVVLLRTTAAVGRVLKLPHRVEVSCFVECQPDHPEAAELPLSQAPYGLCLTSDPRRIHINAHLSPKLAEQTVAHEVRHVWQVRSGLHPLMSKSERERDATVFAAAWVRRARR